MEQSSSPHPETLEEQTPPLISEVVSFVQHIYAAYGWYVLGFSIFLVYAWSKVRPHYLKWRKQKEEDDYAAMIHKNPDIFQARIEAIAAARLRMQEEHDHQAKLKAERAKELEEQKREEWIARNSGSSSSSGQRLGSKTANAKDAQPGPSQKKGTNFRPEYNPLMGSGGSGGYRPAKRGCPGGGCGKK